MFSPLSLQEKKLLQNSGKIYISIVPAWKNTQSLNSIPYNIYYSRIDDTTYDDILLYTCYITISSHMVTIGTLKENISLKTGFLAYERVSYSILKMVIEQIIDWAQNTGKPRLTIISKLSHIVEHLIDLEFTIENEKTYTAKNRLITHYTNIIGKKLLF